MQEEVIHFRSGKEQYDPHFLEVKRKIRSFQNRRLRSTYHDLVEDVSFRPAARFFLDHLYGLEDLEKRDFQTRRLLPKAEQYLPSNAISVLSGVLQMDLLAEQMDTRMASELIKQTGGDAFDLTPALYLKVFRAVDARELRVRQIALVSDVGKALIRLLRFPVLFGLLKMTRVAAQKANLEDFHEFLLEGLRSFKALRNPDQFFYIIQSREQKLLSLIFEQYINDFPDYQSLSR